MCRTYAEEGITLTDLFEELAQSLESQLEALQEDGFLNCYVALQMNRRQIGKPSAFRTALSDLEAMLSNNMDRLSLETLVDFAFLFV